ncbi:hypothetical protein M3Y99_02002300 [Aphelenchoides fujianensis]|nr:hypothetical protein M3Y99_02002300 [Aphelenchoides fujianensis]
MPAATDGIQTLSGGKRRAPNGPQRAEHEPNAPEADSPPQKRFSRSERLFDAAWFSPVNSPTPPLYREPMVVVNVGMADGVSPPYVKSEVEHELANKGHNMITTRRNKRVFMDPFVYYEMREYVLRGRGSLEGLVNLIREQGGEITKRALADHFAENIPFYSGGSVEEENVLDRIKREMNNEPFSIALVNLEPTPDPKKADEEAVERRILHLLEHPDLTADEQHEVEEEFEMFNPDLNTSDDINSAVIMTNEELEFYQSLSEEALQLLDDFNFRRIQNYEYFLEAFKNKIHVMEELNDVFALRILHYRRFENPPPLPAEAKELSAEEANAFLDSLGDDVCYLLDLFTHNHIYGVETVGLLIEAHTGQVLTEKSVRRLLYARRRIRPPETTQYDDRQVTVTTGYLSHDYWPSLLCVPEGDHHVRFFNLKNARSDGELRHYRCSKCCTIKASASRNIKNPRYSKDKIDADLQVPKLLIRGQQVITNWLELDHYRDCQPTPIPVMLAEQLDRRARRQASLGLLAPREAWTEAMVQQMHPGFKSVAELFPDYNDTRGQYSRNFHKYKRTISMRDEDKPIIEKKKLLPSNFVLYNEEDMKEIARPHILTCSRSGLRRGQEADELLGMHVSNNYKRVVAPGYVAVENLEYYYEPEDGHECEYLEASELPVNVDPIEQKEVVVTDRTEPTKELMAAKEEEQILVVN